MRSLLFVLTFVLLLQGVHSAQWASTSPQDGVVIYACANGSVTIPWKYILSSGDVLGNIQWDYNGNSQEIVAISNHGNFVVLPVFANRVTAVDNAGITVSPLVVADSGNYSVTVHVNDDSGPPTVLHRTVLVEVSNGSMTQAGQIHVTQTSEAVLDPASDQWAIQLQCGNFTFSGDPPDQVEWIMPSGSVVNSSDFNDNHFNLLLTNPVQGGNYTCRVTPQRAADACLYGNGQASIDVDKVDARLFLLEKENQQLKVQLKTSDSNISLLQLRNEQLEEQLKQSDSNISLLQLKDEQLDSNISRLQQVQTLEQTKVADVQDRVDGLENRTHQQIGFHATSLLSDRPPKDTPLIFNNVHYNHGDAYNDTTGYFTAPYPGLYFFAGTTGPSYLDGDSISNHVLYVDRTQLGQTKVFADEQAGHHTQATVHAAAHLTPGQRVWVGSHGDTYFSTVASFSGFLISLDP